jgi:hypothetical protein
MLGFVLGIGSGAFLGFLTGAVCNRVEIWYKDTRDGRLPLGVRPPSDRVSPRYHWVFMVLGALHALVLLIFGVSWRWPVFVSLAGLVGAVTGGAAFLIVMRLQRD